MFTRIMDFVPVGVLQFCPVLCLCYCSLTLTKFKSLCWSFKAGALLTLNNWLYTVIVRVEIANDIYNAVWGSLI